jgi:sugar phosphate isomerase/epimerase
MNWPLSAFADEIDGDIDVQFEQLVHHDIKLLDLRSAFGKNVMQLTDDEVDQILDKTERLGICLNCVGSPVNKVKTSEAKAEDELAKVVRSGEIAKRAGINRIRVFTPETNDWEELKAWVGPQVDHAVKNDLLLMHENDGHYYGAYPDQAKRLFDEFGGTNFRAAYDFANAVRIGFKAMDDWFPWLLPHLETLHLKDEKNGKVVPAGDGEGQVIETLAWLKEQGWEGVLTIEPHLQLAGDRGGFTGVESFAIATNTLKGVIEKL